MCLKVTDSERAREMVEGRNERAEYFWVIMGIAKRGEINEEEREREIKKNKREYQREKQ